jgi:choline-phosphate cytidylyltransferase
MTNWSNTGQELGRELRQLWNSRPNSPAPTARNSVDYMSSRGVVSPTGNKSHVSRVEALGRPESINGREPDFATGYSLGLIGGVRAWVCLFLDLF